MSSRTVSEVWPQSREERWYVLIHPLPWNAGAGTFQYGFCTRFRPSSTFSWAIADLTSENRQFHFIARRVVDYSVTPLGKEDVKRDQARTEIIFRVCRGRLGGFWIDYFSVTWILSFWPALLEVRGPWIFLKKTTRLFSCLHNAGRLRSSSNRALQLLFQVISLRPFDAALIKRDYMDGRSGRMPSPYLSSRAR